MKRAFVYVKGQVREAKHWVWLFNIIGFTLRDKKYVLKKIEKSGENLKKYCEIYSKLCEVEANERIADAE